MPARRGSLAVVESRIVVYPGEADIPAIPIDPPRSGTLLKLFLIH
jgi:hypothetical protein